MFWGDLLILMNSFWEHFPDVSPTSEQVSTLFVFKNVFVFSFQNRQRGVRRCRKGVGRSTRTWNRSPTTFQLPEVSPKIQFFLNILKNEKLRYYPYRIFYNSLNELPRKSFQSCGLFWILLRVSNFTSKFSHRLTQKWIIYLPTCVTVFHWFQVHRSARRRFEQATNARSRTNPCCSRRKKWWLLETTSRPTMTTTASNTKPFWSATTRVSTSTTESSAEISGICRITMFQPLWWLRWFLDSTNQAFLGNRGISGHNWHIPALVLECLIWSQY